MTLEEAEKVLRAADEADTGHKLELTRLVDGICTYTVQCCGETREFEDTDDAYEWVRERKLIVRAQAAQEALKSYGDQRFIEGATAMREMAAEGVDGDDHTSRYLCCNGYECGCQGVSLGSYLAHQILALDPNQLKDTDHG